VRKYVEDVDTARTFDDPLPNIANYQTSNPVVARMLTMVSDSFDPMRSGAPNFQHRMRVAELDFVRMVNPNASSADVSTLNREGADALAETAPLPLVGQKLAESMDDGTVLPGDATNVEVPKPKQPPSLPGDPTAVEGRKGKQPPS